MRERTALNLAVRQVIGPEWPVNETEWQDLTVQIRRGLERWDGGSEPQRLWRFVAMHMSWLCCRATGRMLAILHGHLDIPLTPLTQRAFGAATQRLHRRWSRSVRRAGNEIDLDRAVRYFKRAGLPSILATVAERTAAERTRLQAQRGDAAPAGPNEATATATAEERTPAADAVLGETEGTDQTRWSDEWRRCVAIATSYAPIGGRQNGGTDQTR